MAINPIQVKFGNNSGTSSIKKKQSESYLDAKGAISTKDNVKPLPPKGYLIKDNLGSSIKYFFKDMGYDFKAVKDGYKGAANDHQLGRLNDLGLKIGGIGIATYLATQTRNPKARVMEYIGLGTFLASMSLYPKLAINLPARMRYGFDIDKEYIDDQGRKKSVMQDANYIPFDMYLSRYKDEDLSKIGDKLGIPKNIPNRNEVVKDEMRKKSIQNNTLWMLTAAATPAITALTCCGIEKYLVGPAIERSREAKYNKQITELLKKISESTALEDNELSTILKNKLSKYKGKELSKEAFDDIYKVLTKNLDNNISEALKKDLTKIVRTGVDGQEAVVINKSSADSIISVIKNSIGKQNRKALEEVFVPTKEEIESVIKNFTSDNKITENSRISMDKVPEFKNALRELFDSKIANSKVAKSHKKFFDTKAGDIIGSISQSLKTEKSSVLTDKSIEEIVNLAKVLGEFKDNYKLLDKCKSFKFEHAPETTMARAYEKFEQVFLKELNISYKELKKMRESERFTEEILDKKITELCKDSERYNKAITKLGKVISEMEKNLHGADESKSFVLDLIQAIEMNYNKTAQRLNNISSTSFENTIRALINDNVNNIKESPSSRSEIIDLLDGLLQQKNFLSEDMSNAFEYMQENSRGIGSSKYNDIMRIVERYQGAKNSLNRILHTFDVYKRSMNPNEFAPNLSDKSKPYIEQIILKGKEALLKATSSKHTLKLDTVNNPLFYKDLMNAIWAFEVGSPRGVKQKGLVENATRQALKDAAAYGDANLLERFQYYISRFRNIVTSNDIDFTKRNHIFNGDVREKFTRSEKTRSAFFNLIGKTPVDFAKEAANKKYNTQKWVRTVSAIAGSIFGVAVLAQFGFKKYTESKYMKEMQVNNEQN